MKTLLTILFVCLLPLLTKAQMTYYVSNAGSDANNGTSQATAWQSLSKVNSATFNPGDQILFKRGDVFVGRITVNQSGTSGNPITFGAYGTGANPVFNGLVSVTSWTDLGGNIWESTNAVTTLPTLKLVLINGVNTPMGCLPNRDTTYPFLPNYFNIDSHTGTGNGATTITSTSLTTNWTGADIVVRVNHWTLDKEPITSQSGTTVSFTGQTTSDPIQNNWGFWIQNDPRTLDVQNEWYFDPVTKKLRIYSTSQPSDVKVTTIDTIIYSRVHNYITITNIDFKGANNSAIVFSACNNATVTNCNIQYTGASAIEANDGSNNLNVENMFFGDIGGACVWNTDGGANWVIKNNKFRRIDLVSVIKNNDYTNAPIEINSPGALVQYNDIDSTGYEGIHFRGNDVQIRNNFVNHTSMLRDDGGGIYTGFANETGKIVDGNIVLNSVGNARGVGSRDAAGNGIYNDGMSVGVTVTNNTVAHIVSAGIFLNNNQGMNVRGNTVYDVGGDYWTRGCLMIQAYTGSPYAGYQRNNSVTNNIFFQKRPSQVDIFNYADDNSNNSIQDFGVIDSNYYAKGTDNTYFVTYRPQYGSYQNLNFSEWQTASGKEAHGSYLAEAVDTNNIKFVYNPTKNDSTISLDGIYKDVKGVTYNGNITLSPYRSAILIYDSPLASPPTVTTSGNQSITATSTNIFSTPVAGSGHTITAVKWTQLSGPSSATIGTSTSNNTNVSNLINGQYVFQIFITQDDGQTAFADVTITVNLSTNIYYISNSGNDNNDGLTEATPWKTLDKVNATTFNAGNQILFKRGDTFYGSLTVSNSGTSDNPIIYGAYGSGANPVISGFTTLTGWTSVGGGIYQSACPSCSLTDNMVVIDGIERKIGRYPNTGYLTFESASGNTSITDNELTNTPNWTGGEVVIRKNDWIIDRGKITSHSGSTINYTGTSSYNGIAGFGYFIQNDSLALDTMGEWYLSPSKNMKVYFGSNTPSDHTVQTSTIDTLINLNGKDYITFDNLDLEGANVAAIQATSFNHVTIQNCSINFSGTNAISLDGASSYFTAKGNVINHSNNNAINTQYNSTQTYSYIGHNTISNSGTIAGMGKNDDGNYEAILNVGSRAIYEFNRIDTTGYIPITFGGDSTIVRSNSINYFCFLKQDGGGIYGANNGTDSIQRLVKNNIVLNGIGAIDGTNSIYTGMVAGIYLDNLTAHVTVENNTVAYCNQTGINLNQAHSITLNNNTLYGNNNGFELVNYTDNPTYAVNFTKNIISRQLGVQELVNNTNVVHVNNTNINFSFPNAFYSVGTIDSNYYVTPDDSSFLFANRYLFNGATKRTFADWKTYAGEINSSLNTNTAIFKYNDSENDTTIALDAGYVDVTGNAHTGSITLAPFTSVVLIQVAVAPTASAGTNQTITLPTNQITLSGSYTTANGHTATLLWTKVSGSGTQTIANNTTLAPTVSGLTTAGSYVFQLKVTQDDGQIATSTVTVTVNQAPQQPYIHFPVQRIVIQLK